MLVALLLATGCAAPERIAEGDYAGSNGAALTVHGQFIDFYMPASGQRPATLGTRCIHEVQPDGSVNLYGSSNSAYFLDVVSDWEWHWTGMEIQSKHRKDATVVTYQKVRYRTY